jgi:hypothetical protein
MEDVISVAALGDTTVDFRIALFGGMAGDSCTGGSSCIVGLGQLTVAAVSGIEFRHNCAVVV